MFVIGVMLLTGLGIGGVLYALFFSQIQSETAGSKRLKSMQTGGSGSSKGIDTKSEQGRRRKQVADALGDLEEKNKAREKNISKPPLKTLLKQAGIKMPITRFYVIQAVVGVVSFFLFLILGSGIFIALGAGFAFGFGFPRWVVGYIRNRRMNKFLLEFPNAIDVIVRAIKSGLPLNDGLRLIAAEAKEPVRTEFQRIVEAQQLGIGTPEACLRMYTTMPVTEANFFAVVIQIQQQAGGNLAEALGNLSNVLRARKSMKAKISAMSMEAKASGAIIGVLPFIVAILTYLTSPDYIMPLFTTDTGNIILAISGVWMAIGIFVMKQMISFEV